MFYDRTMYWRDKSTIVMHSCAIWKMAIPKISGRKLKKKGTFQHLLV
jgi:hypothetical protein